MTTPMRGEVWRVRFDPAEGDEIKKIRTAVVVSANGVGKLRLKIVAPITEWRPPFAAFPWFVHLLPTPTNGLSKESGADTFQVKSLSESRFMTRLGALEAKEMHAIVAAIKLCVGAT